MNFLLFARRYFFIGFFVWGLFSSSAQSSDSPSPPLFKDPFHAAAGGSAAWGAMDSGLVSQTSFFQFSPEILGYGYFPWRNGFWFRPGIRFGIAWLQPEMPQAMRIRDQDFKIGIENGILYNGPVVPSLSLGGGVVYRNTILETDRNFVTVEKDLISSHSLIPYLQCQIGVGFPIEKGLIVLEPYGRYVHLFGDPRIRWVLGVETTFSIL